MSNFGEEREKRLQAIREMPPGIEAIFLLKDLREQFDWAITGYRNALKTLKDTLYEDRKHFVLELIQNADDAQFSHDETAELKFIINNDSLELFYNEKGFDTEDVIAITDTGVSTKIQRKSSAHSFIGEKGIGFKSVFSLASEIEIESPPWHFALEGKDERLIIPKPLKGGKLKERDGTRLKIKFIRESDIDEVASTISGFVNENRVGTILFLQRLSRFTIEDHRKSPVNVVGIYLTPSNRIGESLTINLLNSDNRYEYILYHEDIEFSVDLAKERWERLVCEEPLKRRISAAAIITKSSDDKVFKGRLFCYLPTLIELPIPIFLQVDGFTKADRERLHEPGKGWNKYLLDKIPAFLKNAILEWRNHPTISKKLPDYIPTNDSADQLTDVFSRLRYILKTTPWIRTFEKEEVGWTKPENAIRADKFWTEWFIKDKVFRKRVEKTLNIKFVHPDWANNPDWKTKWKYYEVGVLNKISVARHILPNVQLPSSLLHDDDNLIELYEQLLNWDKSIFDICSKDLLLAPIYPFKDGKREPLKTENGMRSVFWLSVKSKRSTGLENLYEYRIINQQYTYMPKAGSNAPKKSKIKTEKKARRNIIVRSLLRKLGIEELDENKIHALQINWLCNYKWQDENDKTPYEIFNAIFESFIAKQSQADESYFTRISNLSEAIFPSEMGNLMKVKEMILPKNLRLKSEDKIFENTDLEIMKLPDEILDPAKTTKKKIEGWRRFLLSCGICNRLRFVRKEKTYERMHSFEYYDERRHDLLRQIIRADYTWHNPITIKTTEIERTFKKILESPGYDEELFSKMLYEAWLEESENFHYYCRPDYFVAEYLRYQDQTKRVKDMLWAGVERDLIPLKTINNEVSKANNAKRILEGDINHLKISRSFFSLVLETNESSKGYKTEYLDSLKIRMLNISDLNLLWSNNDIEKDIIIRIAIEFSKIGVDMTGLKLFDKNTNTLQPAIEWKIAGQINVQVNESIIDEQYGKIGYKLGKILDLRELSDELKRSEGIIYDRDSTLKADFELIYEYPSDYNSPSKLHGILIKWKERNSEARKILSYESRFVLNIRNDLQKPIVMFNNSTMVSRLKEMEIPFYNLVINESDRLIFNDAVKDLGLSLLEDTGELSLIEKSQLDKDEQKIFSALVNKYINTLNDKEGYRFDSKLRDFGKPERWNQKILRVESAKRIVGENLVVNTVIPYFDGYNFIVHRRQGLEEILAHLLSFFDFTRYKSALNEIHELKNNLIESRPEIETQDSIDPNLQVGNVEDIRNRHRQGLKNDRLSSKSNNEQREWKVGLSPEEEERSRKMIGDKFIDSINKGPDIYEKQLRSRLSKNVKPKIEEDQKIVDPDAIDPKAFLLEEYDGRCQICATELLLNNGNKWIETYRIVESRNEIWWSDRPFNILGLCPNCHALAKHGGGCDFSNIEKEAHDLLNGDTWAQEVPEYSGDFYSIDVNIDDRKKRLVMSKLHLNHIAVLYDK